MLKLISAKSVALFATSLLIVASAYAQANGSLAQKMATKNREILARHGRQFSELDYGSPVDKKKPNPNGELDLSGGMLYDYVADPNPIPAAPKTLISNLASNYELVVSGTARSFESEFTAKKAFLYSIWTFQVDEVFKNSSSDTKSGDLIQVLRSGGRLLWHGRTVFAHDIAFPDFVVKERYILFLKPTDNEANVYTASALGSFRLGPQGVFHMIDPQDRGDALTPLSASKTAEQFTELVRRSVQ